MKRLGLFMLATGLISFTSCDKDENLEGNVNASGVSEQVIATFNDMYPNAQNVEWNVKNNYAVASFFMPVETKSNDRNHAAWFDNSLGEWAMTETDIEASAIPQAVLKAFSESEYADWRIDDIDLVLREGLELVYVIEVEQGERSVDLYYTKDGVLVKTIVDSDDDYDYSDFIPQKPNGSIQEFISKKYPDARIIEIDIEDNGTEVEIVDGFVVRDLLFGHSGNWIYTKTETHFMILPPEISQAFKSSKYAQYHIDDIDFYQTPEKEYYRFDLESYKGDVKIDIMEDGSIVEVAFDDDDWNGGNAGMISPEIQSFIDKKYPGAKVKEKDYEDGYLEIEIWHEGREKKVYFNGTGSWVYSKWDMKHPELPSVVIEALDKLYPSYSIEDIDDIEKIERESSSYYLIELEINDRDMTVRIDEAGNVLK